MSALMGRMLLNTRPPGAEAAQVLGKVKELKATGPVISGELTPEGAKELASLRRGRRGGEPKNASGDVRFWLKDGALQKYALHTVSTISRQDGEEMTINRTTTVEFREVGTAKVEVPEAAKQKLSAP